MNKKPGIETIIPLSELVKLRKAGKTYGQIGDAYGYSQAMVARYGNKVLPSELRGRLKRTSAVTPECESPVSKDTPRCRDCQVVVDNNLRPIDPELLICTWCFLRRVGVDVGNFCESGMAVAMFGQALMEGEGTETPLEAKVRKMTDRANEWEKVAHTQGEQITALEARIKELEGDIPSTALAIHTLPNNEGNEIPPIIAIRPEMVTEAMLLDTGERLLLVKSKAGDTERD